MKRIIKCIAFLLLISLLFSFVGCNENIEVLDINPKLNCNFSESFYQLAYKNDDGIHFSRSGFFGEIYYTYNEDGSEKIISDYQLSMKLGSQEDGEECYSVHGDVKYYNGYYYFFVSKFNDGGVDFYRYSKSEKKLQKLFSPDKYIENWVIYENKLIYATAAFLGDTLPRYYLWYYDLGGTEPIQIGTLSTFCFGVFDGKVRFLVDNFSGENTAIYEFDFSQNQTNLIKTFNVENKKSYIYNLTYDSVVFANEKELKVLNIESGKVYIYSLPDTIHYISCYENFAFAYLGNSVYRVNLINGETEKLFDDFDEFGTVNAINDDFALVVCYDGEVFTRSKIYQVNANGEIKKIVGSIY